ncbi:MAG: hypothetical protein KBF66_00925 [Rhodoferax sp.]|uniref:hypothetical protein n=1 Tax=Rhodoferax sp. TaxID=50421 RepID=UPI001B5D1E19|nr:hypothetical protein [Rhodoferax sp.]MBP9904089.1 hypothetical protein [Rhodoferax sp.]
MVHGNYAQRFRSGDVDTVPRREAFPALESVQNPAPESVKVSNSLGLKKPASF